MDHYVLITVCLFVHHSTAILSENAYYLVIIPIYSMSAFYVVRTFQGKQDFPLLFWNKSAIWWHSIKQSWKGVAQKLPWLWHQKHEHMLQMATHICYHKSMKMNWEWEKKKSSLKSMCHVLRNVLILYSCWCHALKKYWYHFKQKVKEWNP